MSTSNCNTNNSSNLSSILSILHIVSKTLISESLHTFTNLYSVSLFWPPSSSQPTSLFKYKECTVVDFFFQLGILCIYLSIWNLFMVPFTGTVNASLLVLTAMGATAPTVLIILRMRLPGVKLLKLHWSVIQMLSGLRLGAAHIRIGIMYVLLSEYCSHSYFLKEHLLPFVFPSSFS